MVIANDLSEFSIVVIAMAVHVVVHVLIFVFVGVVVVIMVVTVFIFVFVGVIVVFMLMAVLVFMFVGVVVVIVVVAVLVFMVVGVVVVIVVMTVLVFVHVPGSADGNNSDAGRDFHDRHISRRAFNHLKQGLFKAGSVDEDHIRLRQRRQIARARLKAVRVSPGRNQRRKFNVISGNAADDIGENAVGSDHFKFVFLRDRVDIG